MLSTDKLFRKTSVFSVVLVFVLLSVGRASAKTEDSVRRRLVNGSFDVSSIGWWWWTPDLDSRVEVSVDHDNRFLSVYSAAGRGRPVEVFSSWIVDAGKGKQTVAVSFKARGQGEGQVSLGYISPQTSLHVRNETRSFALTPEWKTYVFRLPKKPAQGNYYQAVFASRSQMDLDEVELGSAAETAGFQSVEKPEAGVECAEPTWIFYSDEMPRFTVHWSYPDASPADRPVFKYRVTDYDDQFVNEKEVPVETGVARRQEIEIPVHTPGFYRIHWFLGDAMSGQTAFVVTTRTSGDPDPRFAITMGDTNYRQSARQIRRIGAGAIRLHGFFQYHHMQVSDDNASLQMDLSLLDYLQNQTGARLMAMLTGTPKWMMNPQGGFDIPTALTALDTVVQHTSPYIETYEIFNEPNQAFLGSAEEYARYLAAAYDQIKQTHPEKVVAGICPSNILLTYIEQVLKGGAAGKMDVLAFHPYGATSPDVRGIDVELDRLRTLVESESSENIPKLWATEIGYRSNDYPITKPQRYPGMPLSSEAEIARYLVKMNLMLLAGGVERMYWFHLPGVGGLPNPFYYGLTYENPEHAIPKKSVAALCQIVRALSGRAVLGRAETGDDEVYLYRFSGRKDTGDTGCRVFFKNERTDKPHLCFIRSDHPLKSESIAGTELSAFRREGNISVFEVRHAPAYVFSPADAANRVVVPVSVQGVPSQILDGSTVPLSVAVSNVFDRSITVEVCPELPEGWRAVPNLVTCTLTSGETRTLPLEIYVPANGGAAGAEPILQFKVQIPAVLDEPYYIARQTRLKLRRYLDLNPRGINAAALKWAANSPGNNWNLTKGNDGVSTRYVFNPERMQNWGTIRAAFNGPQDFGGFRNIKLEMKFSDPSTFILSMMFAEADGVLYRAVAMVDTAIRDRWQTVTINMDDFTQMAAGKEDKNGKLDLDQIMGVGLVANSHSGTDGTFEIRKITFEP